MGSRAQYFKLKCADCERLLGWMNTFPSDYTFCSFCYSEYLDRIDKAREGAKMLEEVEDEIIRISKDLK